MIQIAKLSEPVALGLALVVETELPEQDQPSQKEHRTNEPIIFRGIDFLERDPALSTTYQGSCLACVDALQEKSDPMLYTSAGDISRKYNSSIEDLTKRYAAAPAGDVYSPQAQGDGSNLYGRQDDYLQTSRYSLGSSAARYDQLSLTSQSYGLSGTSASRSSVTDRYGSGLFGANGSGASVMDKYASTLLEIGRAHV